MLQSIKDLRGYTIFAVDGEIGSVQDLYFDDFRWRIRYYVVETGAWLFGRRVLISPAFAGPADANARGIPVSLTQEQVKSSPDIDTDKPVSRQHASQLAPSLGWPAYGLVAEVMFPPVVLEPVPPAPGTENDPRLRSTNEVRGYHVNATDGDVGRVEDFIFDEESWDIRLIVVDTGKWLKRDLVLIKPQWIADISWEERRVRMDVNSEAIRSSPEFQPLFPIAPERIAELQKHYDQEIPQRSAEVPKVSLSRTETKALYNKISKVYDFLSERSEEPVRRAALNHLAARPGESVLEIGFGTGHCVVEMAKAVGPSGKVHGVDLSDGMLKEAAGLVEAAGVADRVELRLGDAIALPYESSVMDAVLMTFTLELFDNLEIPIVLQECKRVLKPEGRIVVAAMSKDGDHGLIFEAYEWTHRHFPNFVDCRPIAVRESVEAAGFEVTVSERMRIWVPVEIVVGVKADS